MSKWFVVVRLLSVQRPRRPLLDIVRFAKLDSSAWHFELKDLDHCHGIFGFSIPHSREDAARRYFNEFRGRDGTGSSMHLIFTRAFTRGGAAKTAVKSLLCPTQAPGELLENYTRND